MGIVNKIMEIMMRSRMNVNEESIKNPVGTQERVLFENIKKSGVSHFFDSLLFSYAQQSYPPPFEGGYNAMLLCGAVAKLVQPAVSQRQYQIRGYHYEIQYVNYDHIGYASADQLAR